MERKSKLGGAYDAARPEGFPVPSPIGRELRGIQVLGTRFEQHLRERLHINATDMAAMEYLMQRGTATATELARRLGISTAATTLVIDRLAAAGHVERRPHPTDRRKVVVTPAQESVECALGALLPIVAGVQDVVDALPETDRQAVERFLRAVSAVYRHTLGDDIDPADAAADPSAPRSDDR